MAGNREWFNDWFDSPYYHILYRHRDFEEAKTFIDTLGSYLEFRPGQQALDAGCGRGRHAVYLHEKGLKVCGIDLSEKNIGFASQFEQEGLEFHVQDIRKVFRENHFDYIFNLFTSFGYFDEEEDNYRTIEALAMQLKETGVLVIDFLNPYCIVDCLVPEEEQTIEGTTFHITRKAEENFIIKNIVFRAGEQEHSYFERVKLLKEEDFLKYFNFAGLSVREVFGNYRLEPFDRRRSERMIFIAGKTR